MRRITWKSPIKLRFWMCLCLGLISWTAIAQEFMITGEVNSPDGPVPFANIYLRGTSHGTSADENGIFTL
ncbi:MAG: carboxypeptidase-like regulatory domain-containing protein, partial [Eudoraea sp.]|nr:carboxypeptidase-like regulatory domain-containing protein [Eudoraea sp.]